jgi:hypothetical protein
VAASPISIAPTANAPIGNLRRRPFTLTSRRLAANRRNAARSTGPRMPKGKAKVARNAIKHGYFAAQSRWTPEQHRDFVQTLDGLRDDFKPAGVGEESCVWTMAYSYARMAALWRYENIAAVNYHQECERELNARIAAAEPSEAERLEARRERLRRAGLWKPTLPGPREATAIIRYQGRLDRMIRGAMSDLRGIRSMRVAAPSNRKVGKRRETSSSGVLSRCGEGPRTAVPLKTKSAKTNPLRGSRALSLDSAERASEVILDDSESAKTNPLSSMFMGNRHERRRAKAIARQRR